MCQQTPLKMFIKLLLTRWTALVVGFFAGLRAPFIEKTFDISHFRLIRHVLSEFNQFLIKHTKFSRSASEWICRSINVL